MDQTSFLRGYADWLAKHRRRIAVAVLVVLAVFVWALWLTTTPQDPFAYELF